MQEETIFLEPGKPLRFDDMKKIDPSEIAEHKHVVQISNTIAAYRVAVKDFLKGKYSHYSEMVPRHLRTVCSIFIVRCSDGTIVRYDPANADLGTLRVGETTASLAEIAPMLSECFIHWGDNPEQIPFNDKSPTLTMEIVDPTGVKRDHTLCRFGVFTTGKFPEGFEYPKPPGRPVCLVSIANECIIETGGVLLPANEPIPQDTSGAPQYVTHSRIQLPVGWLAIDIYPNLDDEYWKPEYAGVWAEMDILASAARCNLRENQLNALDPRSETRKQYAELLVAFEGLLKGPEEPIHQFLLKHPELICPTSDQLWSKVAFGATKSDFVFREPHNEYTLVEIEAPERKLFRADGQQHGDLTHAINQTLDWVRYIEDNKRTVEDELGLKGISVNPCRLVIMGRSNSLTAENRRKLTTIQNDQPKLRILTYDDLLLSARANLERILGPLVLIGQNVKLYIIS